VTPRTFWAAESRKSGVAPARFCDFSEVVFVPSSFAFSWEPKKLLAPQAEEQREGDAEGCNTRLLQAFLTSSSPELPNRCNTSV
jgi:hypothetical protein